MPRQETRNLYRLEELKESHPEAYAKVHERWKYHCMVSGDIPWAEETMASLKAVIEACGASFHNYYIGPYVYSYIEVDDRESTIMQKKDLTWFCTEVLRKLERESQKTDHPFTYLKGDGTAEFPGNCPFTGYCADETFLEAVYKALDKGETLTEALESLASIASRMMEEDCEQQQDEETMMINWGGREFTETGEHAP